MRGFSLLLVLSLIIVTICEAKKKRKKKVLNLRNKKLDSDKSGKGG